MCHTRTSYPPVSAVYTSRKRHFYLLNSALPCAQNGTFKTLNKQLKKNGKKFENKYFKIWLYQLFLLLL